MSFDIAARALIVTVILLVYKFIGTTIEHYKCRFGHEASYTIMVGALISLIVQWHSGWKH